MGALQATMTPRECYTTPRNAFYLTPSGVLLERDLCMGQPTGGATGNRGPEHRDTRGAQRTGASSPTTSPEETAGIWPQGSIHEPPGFSPHTFSWDTCLHTCCPKHFQNYIQGPLLFNSLLFYPGYYQFSLPSFLIYTFISNC